MDVLSADDRVTRREAIQAVRHVHNLLFDLATHLTVVVHSSGAMRPGSSVYVDMAALLDSAALLHQVCSSELDGEPVSLREVPSAFEPVGSPITQDFPHREVVLLHLLSRQWRTMFIRPVDRMKQCAWLTNSAQLLRRLHRGQELEIPDVRQLALLAERLVPASRRLEHDPLFDRIFLRRAA